MFRRFVAFCAALVMIAGAGASVSVAQTSDQGPAGPPRIGFVVGNAAYQTAPLATALNDAGLVAEALRSVGFEIVEGADLGASDLVRSFREYLAKLEAAGPDAVGFVYLSGYGFAFEGENYLAGIDARLERESDVPLEAVRVSDLVRSLAGAPARARVLVLDAARKLPFRIAEQGLPPGLVAVEAPPGMLIGFSAGPGQIAPDIADPNAGQGAYGAYATAIAEMVRAGGLDLPEVFTRIRARTHQITEGRQTPWDVSALTQPVVLVPAEAAPDAPAPALAAPVRERRPFRDIPADEAYAAAVERDDLAGYVEFVETYPQSPYAKRVWVIIRARREALAWMKAVEIDSPQSYWTYLRRYPKGIYAADARRRLARLSAAYEPPPDFAPVEFADVPPPLPDEPVGFYYDDYPPAPPPPVFLIAPRPRWWVDLPPPPPPVFYGGLPPVRVMPVIPRVRPGVRIPVVLPGRPLPPGPGPVIRPGGPRPVGPGPVGPGPGFRPGGPGVVGPGPVGPGPGVRPGGFGGGGPGVVAPGGPGAPAVRPGGPGGPPPQGVVTLPPAGGPGVRPGPNVRPVGPPGTTVRPVGPVGPGGRPVGPNVRPGGPGGPPPAGVVSRPPGPPAVGPRPVVPPGRTPPAVVNRPPPPQVVNRPPPVRTGPPVRTAPPPTAVRTPPPPRIVNRPPPPAAVNRPAPVVNRPPPVVNRPPPPMVRPAPPPMRAAPPPARPAPPVARAAPPPPPRPAAPPPKRCVVINGQQVCR